MGLDSYLEAEFYVSEYLPDSKEISEDLEKLRLTERLGGKRIKKLVVDVGYWRKCNHIHAWFVNNVQGGRDECQRSYVNKNQLKNLLDTVNQVLAEPNLAPSLLPTQIGFFFGSTDYDEYYMNDLIETKKIIEDILNNSLFDNWEFYYKASW